MAEDRKETVILSFEVDVDSQVESIDSLTKANKALREERKNLNLLTAEGKKRTQEINATIDQNTSKIKANVSAIEQQKINIGNYKSALEGVHPALGKVGEGLEAGAAGFKAMAKSALAFIATPIGAILAALVAVFTLLKTALSQNDALMDKFENVTNAVSVVVDVLVSRVGKLGEALIALAQGNFNKAINLTAEAFSGLSEEIGNAVKQQQLFLDASRELEDSTLALSVQTSKYENEIKRLIVAAKNRSLTFDQQEALLQRSLELEEELIAKKTDIARRDLVVTARRLRVAKEFQQQENENFDQYIQRLLDSDKLGFEEKKKIADKLNALEAARGASLPFQEKVANTLASIDEKRAAAADKLSKSLEANAEAERKARIAKLDRELKGKRPDNPLEDAFKTEVKVNTDITKLMKDQLDTRAKYLDNYYKKKNANAQKSAEIEIAVERQKVAIIGNLIGSLATLAAEDSEARKVFASAQALINTYLSATAAYASGSEINVFFGVAAAAAAVAAGLANVAKINNVEFAEGGYTGPGHKYKPAGIVHAGEVVWNQEDVAKVGGPAMANAMRPTSRQSYNGRYMDGGLVANSIAQPINQQLEILNIVKNMPPQELSVKEVTKIQKRIRVKENVSRV
jgi:hypothetical protein